MLSDRRDIEVGGKIYTLRQRCLYDVIASSKAHLKYAKNDLGAAYVLAASVKDGLMHDNYRFNVPVLRKLFPINTSWVLKRFTFAQLQYLHNELNDLETYKVKKKTESEQVG